MKRIVILISGRGSNMRGHRAALSRSRLAGGGGGGAVQPPAGRRPGVRGGPRHRHREWSTTRQHASARGLRRGAGAALDAHAPDLVVLAGFMRILGAGFVQHYDGRLLNIHPSLLPAFPGLHTHRRALQAGCKRGRRHGALRDARAGPRAHRDAVGRARACRATTSRRLAERVLATEHVIYPQAVRWFVEGRLLLDDGQVRQLDGASQVLVT
jgi:phosphoribosylglycinamide formyltransferase-1